MTSALSLAAARADNFYHPPDWDPSKKKSNPLRQQHPLRERAARLDEGILVIRFEMPFNVWCEGCGHLIGKGVRFNADKQQVDSYFSTKVWSFTMASPCCQTKIEVRTDPKHHDFVVVRGARRKHEEFSAGDAQVLELPDAEERSARMADPMSRLEHVTADRDRAAGAAARLGELEADARAKTADDYTINKALRRRNREARKEEKGRDARRRALGLPDSLRLLPEPQLNPPQDAHDTAVAAAVVFGNPQGPAREQRRQRRSIRTESIFTQAAVRAASVPESTAKRKGGDFAFRVPPARLDKALGVAGGGVGKRGPAERAAEALRRQRLAERRTAG